MACALQGLRAKEVQLDGNEGPVAGQVVLRDVASSDLPVFFEQQLDPEATRMAAFPARDEAAFLAHWAKILDNPAVVKRAILSDGQVAGYIVRWEHDGRLLVGYWLSKACWGKGFATRALGAFLQQIRERPLYAWVARQNAASRRVLEKCGFSICQDEPEEYLLKLSATEKDEAQTLRGLLIKEGLKDESVLSALQITRTERWDVKNAAAFQPPTWTAISFEGDAGQADAMAEALSQALKPDWYCNMATEEHIYVIFGGKAFKYRPGDPQGRAEAQAHGRSVGVPESQLDWGEE